MKLLLALTLVLGLTNASLAGDLNQNALETLLSTKDLKLSGDVHADETLQAIYKNGVAAGAVIQNECAVIARSNLAECTLLISWPLGETAFQYKVLSSGLTLASKAVYVIRGS